MTNDIDNTQDTLDVRDIIARVEELEETPDIEDDISNLKQSDEADELVMLRELLGDLCGNGGDEQWKGDWYPVTLIRESYFEEYMDQMLEDCGELKPYADRPCYIKIEIDYDALLMDYTSCEFDGVTYYYR